MFWYPAARPRCGWACWHWAYVLSVLVPALTWAAVGAAVVNAGVVPVAVDVEPNSLCMSPEAAARAVAEVGATGTTSCTKTAPLLMWTPLPDWRLQRA